MPTFKITDPNSGRVLNVTGDSPPSQEELTQLFAQFQVDIVPQVSPELAAVAAEQGPLEAGLIGAGRGLSTIGRALGFLDPESDVAKEAFQEFRN